MLQIEGGLFTDIVIIFLAALLGGLLARSLRLPMLLGYLAGGIEAPRWRGWPSE